jgi:hypothetical protein
MERPLVPLQEHAFKAALSTTDRATQTAALWFTDTRQHIEAYARVKGEGDLLWPWELDLYMPVIIPAKMNEDQQLEVVESDQGQGDIAVVVLREILVRRGLLKKRRG